MCKTESIRLFASVLEMIASLSRLLHFHDCEQTCVENTFCGIPTGPLRDLASGFVLTPEALGRGTLWYTTTYLTDRPFTVAKVKRSPVERCVY